MKKSIFEKLTSRKFLVTAITAIAGIITMIIGENEIVQIISGAAMTIVPTIVYCITEGAIDAKSIKTITDTTVEAAEKLGADKNVIDAIDKVGDVGEVLVETIKE